MTINLSQTHKLASSTLTAICGVQDGYVGAANVKITNTGGSAATVDLARTTGRGVPTADEYIVEGTSIAAGATLSMDGLVLAPLQTLFAEASSADILVSVSGFADPESGRYEMARLRIEAGAGESADLLINTNGSSNFDIDWGDGAVSDNSPSEDSFVSHVYRHGFRGEVVVYSDTPNFITKFQSTSGRWSFDLSCIRAGVEVFSFNAPSAKIRGEWTDLPSSAVLVVIRGASLTVGASGGDWPFATTGFRLLRIEPDALTEAEVDRILLAAESVTSFALEKTIIIAARNAPPSAAGEASAAQLITNGATTVTYN